MVVTWQTSSKHFARNDSDMGTEDKRLVPLSRLKAGERARLVRVNAGQGLKSRLAAMGLVRDVEITVVSSGYPGPFIISVKGCKMMLGRGMTHKIMVMQC